MGWTQSLGLHHLARLARGGDDGADSHAASDTPGPLLRKPQLASVPDALPRRRADLHPDAPPRAPLFASRDLPVVPELSVVDAGPDIAPPPPPVACASPIRDTTSQDRPRPLPRSPAPLSDSDLHWVRGLLDDHDEPRTIRPDSARAALSDIAVPPAVGTPAPSQEQDAPATLLSLVDRFEQGVAHRIALRDAENARGRFAETVTPAAVPARDDDEDLPQEMDDALNAALATLRKLSVNAHGR